MGLEKSPQRSAMMPQGTLEFKERIEKFTDSMMLDFCEFRASNIAEPLREAVHQFSENRQDLHDVVAGRSRDLAALIRSDNHRIKDKGSRIGTGWSTMVKEARSMQVQHNMTVSEMRRQENQAQQIQATRVAADVMQDIRQLVEQRQILLGLIETDFQEPLGIRITLEKGSIVLSFDKIQAENLNRIFEVRLSPDGDIVTTPKAPEVHKYWTLVQSTSRDVSPLAALSPVEWFKFLYKARQAFRALSLCPKGIQEGQSSSFSFFDLSALSLGKRKSTDG